MLLHKLTLQCTPETAGTVVRLRSGPYALHQEFWRLQPAAPAATRTFLFRAEPGDAPITAYALSDFVLADPDGHWNIVSRDYSPRVAVGDKLRFDLRLNATMCIRKPDREKPLNVDCVMHYYRQMREAGEKKLSLRQATEPALQTWMESRAESHGFRLASFAVAGYQRWETTKPKCGRLVFGVADVQGRVEVTDVGLFAKTLTGGLGSAKAFGCGLMLVRRQ